MTSSSGDRVSGSHGLRSAPVPKAAGTSPDGERRAITAIAGTSIAVAALLHVWGNPLPLQGSASFTPHLRFATTVVMALAACWCLARPGRVRSLDVLCGVVVLKTLTDLPVVPNHQLLLALLSLCWMLSRSVNPRRPAEVPASFLQAARWTFVIAYGFAAFAKLNTAFLDPEVSCATLLLGSLRAAWTGDASLSPATAGGAIGLTLLIELSVPVLLISRRTRVLGIVLATLFHGALALDPVRHFYDFSAVVLVGVVCFLPSGAMQRWSELYLRTRSLPSALRGALVVAAIALTVLLGLQRVSFVEAWLVALLLLAALSVSVIWTAIRGPADHTASPVSARGLRILLATPVAIALVVGASPYLELRNVTAWNMYSNLRTADGDTNHLLLRRTLPLSDSLSDRVIPLDGDPLTDELPRRALYAQLLMDGPGSSAPVIDGGQERIITYQEARTDMGPFQSRLHRLGAVSVEGPEPCRLASQA
jgi:hypothetical protein